MKKLIVALALAGLVVPTVVMAQETKEDTKKTEKKKKAGKKKKTEKKEDTAKKS